MCNGDLSTNSEYDNRFNINFPLHHALNQVYLNTDLLDKVILTEAVLRPTEKLRSVGPHKSISKKNGNKRKSRLGNKKFRSASKPLYGTYVDPNSNTSLKSKINMGRLKSIIKPFDSGWTYILDLSFKLISLLVIWSYNCNNAGKKNITHLGTSIVRVCRSTLNTFPQWISKP